MINTLYTYCFRINQKFVLIINIQQGFVIGHMDLSNFWNFNPPFPVYNVPQNQYEQRGKYKRSTNNSHKKFISVARKLLFKICSEKERGCFEKQFEAYKNSRTFYFIILAHVKLRMNKEESRRFTTAFVAALNRKIQIYKNQIRNTTNSNFIHFRFQEISDIEFAIKAMELYFDQKIEQAIETVYRKDRLTLFKRQQYDVAVKTILQLEKRLKSYPPGPLFPYVQQDEKDYEYVSRRLPVDFLPELPEAEAQENFHQKRRKQSDEEWQAEEEDSIEPRKRMKHKKKKFEEKISKNEYEIQKKVTYGPLLHLQNSYPLFPDFYKIIFNYEVPNAFSNNLGQQLLQKPHLSQSQIKKQAFLPFMNQTTMNNLYPHNSFPGYLPTHTDFLKQEPRINETQRQKCWKIKIEQGYVEKAKLRNRGYQNQKFTKNGQMFT